MNKPYDSTTKDLLELDPAAWIEFLQISLGRAATCQLVDANVSTITAEADKVLLVEGDAPWLVHLEFQSGNDPSLPMRLQRYNVLLNSRHDLPVLSVGILLRPRAESPEFNGTRRVSLPDGFCYHQFHYKIVRAWEQSVDRLLEGGLAILPLAPLSDVPRERIPDVVRRIKRRLDSEASPAESSKIWVATYYLMGLRFQADEVDDFLGGIKAMEDSTTYQAVLTKGRTEGIREGEGLGQVREARRILLILGQARFGEPSGEVLNTLQAINDSENLERLIALHGRAETWEELLAMS